MAISCGSRAHLEKESVAQVIGFCPLCDRIYLRQSLFSTNHCAVSPTAISLPYVSHVRLSLPGVVLLRERDQGHTVWLQALHPRGCAQNLLFSPCRAMVRSNTTALSRPGCLCNTLYYCHALKYRGGYMLLHLTQALQPACQV